MSLTSTYDDLVNGKITLKEAADLFGTDPTILKMRIGRNQGRVRDTLVVMDAITDGSMSRAEAAEKLGVSPRAINFSMQTWGVVRPIPEYRLDTAKAKVKFEVHYRVACDFIAGRINLDRAAADAKVSDRQMRRIVIDLLDKHAKMAYKDLKHLTLDQMQALARKIMEAEEIDEAKARTIDKVVAGRVQVEDVVARLVTQKVPQPRRRTRASEAEIEPGPGPGSTPTAE